MNLIQIAKAADSGIVKGIDEIIPGGLDNIFTFGLTIGGAIALGTIIYAGILYSLAGDNSSKQKEAREWIWAAVKGLAVIAFGYILITTINPRTVVIEEIVLAELEIPEKIMSDWNRLSESERSGYQYDSSNFSDSEFRCRANGELPPEGITTQTEKDRVMEACGEIPTGIDPLLIQKLDELRIKLGNKPIQIISGYRTPAYNDTLAGSADLSQHMCGRAADIRVEGLSPAAVANAAENIFSNSGLGRYSTFTHVDTRRTGKARW